MDSPIPGFRPGRRLRIGTGIAACPIDLKGNLAAVGSNVVAKPTYVLVLKTRLEHRPAADNGIDAHRCSHSIAGFRPFANT